MIQKLILELNWKSRFDDVFFGYAGGKMCALIKRSEKSVINLFERRMQLCCCKFSV